MKGLNEYWGKALYLVKIGNYIGYNKISELIAINKFTYFEVSELWQIFSSSYVLYIPKHSV